jgi:outer membrane protein TolC
MGKNAEAGQSGDEEMEPMNPAARDGRPTRLWLALAAAGPLMLTACASLSPDQGIDTVAWIAGESTGHQVVKLRSAEDERAAEARIAQLLRRRLTPDGAAQIALLNNKGLQAAYNELAITEAQGAEATLPPSPTLSLARLSAGPELEIERQILVNVLGLLTLPERREIAAVQFRQAQFKAAEETLRVAAEAKRAFYRAVAARQSVKLLQEAKASAEAASELIKKLGESGAVSKLDQAREHVFYAEITGELARAKQTQEADREALIRVLGLWGGRIDFQLADNLPALPGRPLSKSNIEAEALKRRVDVEMARLEVEATARSLGLTNATRLVNVFEIAGKSNYERTVSDDGEVEKTRWRGAEVELQVPIFDFGETRTRQAEETYMRAVNRLAEKAVNARSEVREAYQRYRGAYDFARHYQKEVVPLRQTIADESLLRYNGMLTDIFPVLADVRARIASQKAAIDALRDFWLAHVGLQAALIGGGARSAQPESGGAVIASGGGEAH